MIENARTKVLWLMVVLTIVFAVLTVVHSIWWLIGVVHRRRCWSLLGIYDYTQPNHSILRNYPIVGHMRFLLEDAGPGAAPVPRRERHRRPSVQPRHPHADVPAGQERAPTRSPSAPSSTCTPTATRS